MAEKDFTFGKEGELDSPYLDYLSDADRRYKQLKKGERAKAVAAGAAAYRGQPVDPNLFVDYQQEEYQRVQAQHKKQLDIIADMSDLHKKVLDLEKQGKISDSQQRRIEGQVAGHWAKVLAAEMNAKGIVGSAFIKADTELKKAYSEAMERRDDDSNVESGPEWVVARDKQEAAVTEITNFATPDELQSPELMVQNADIRQSVVTAVSTLEPTELMAYKLEFEKAGYGDLTTILKANEIDKATSGPLIDKVAVAAEAIKKLNTENKDIQTRKTESLNALGKAARAGGFAQGPLFDGFMSNFDTDKDGNIVSIKTAVGAATDGEDEGPTASDKIQSYLEEHYNAMGEDLPFLRSGQVKNFIYNSAQWRDMKAKHFGNMDDDEMFKIIIDRKEAADKQSTYRVRHAMHEELAKGADSYLASGRMQQMKSKLWLMAHEDPDERKRRREDGGESRREGARLAAAGDWEGLRDHNLGIDSVDESDADAATIDDMLPESQVDLLDGNAAAQTTAGAAPDANQATDPTVAETSAEAGKKEEVEELKKRQQKEAVKSQAMVPGTGLKAKVPKRQE